MPTKTLEQIIREDDYVLDYPEPPQDPADEYGCAGCQ